MDNSNQYETEIDLKQLLFSIFIRWRAVILCGVIFALLFGGYKYISAGQGTVDDQALLEYEQAVALYEKTMADYQNELDAYSSGSFVVMFCTHIPGRLRRLTSTLSLLPASRMIS